VTVAPVIGCTELDAHINHPGDCTSPAARDSCEPLDIASLTRRMVANDENAYRIFHEAYINRLSRYLLVVTSGNEDAMREALQATLVRVVRHIKVFQSEEVFWSWLTVLARSSVFDEGRKRRRYLAFLDRFMQHSTEQSIARNSDDADDRLRLLLENNLSFLPFDEQQLVEWKYLARRSVRDIADELQTTEKAVESKLSRVRRKLKDIVLAELKNESPS
jgi:RNA polymerase sigma-70 factor (ECF subfamily)